MDKSRDRKTRVIVGVYIGDRSKESVEKLAGVSTPRFTANVRFVATILTVYAEILPTKRHKAVEKRGNDPHWTI